MRIKSLELSNFRGFLGKHSIDFAYKGDQNLTLILAENEVGKSTILNAFVWCFYGRLTDDTDLKNELVHDEAKTTKAYVQISIVHDDKEFQFKRIHDKGNEELFGWEIDNVDQIHKVHFPESIIKTFLPPELSDYFLFNGEGLKDIIKDSVKLEKSIQDIQGLTAASAALESLESYKKTLLQEAKKLTKKGTENEEKKKKLKSAQKDEESAKNKKKEADRKYDETEEAFKIAEKAWGLVKNSDAKSLKEQRDESQKRLSAINKELINLQNRKKDLIRKYGIDILGFTFTETAQKKLKEAGDIGYPSKFHKTIINDSLADDECKLCERSFKKEPSVKEKLKEKLTLSFDGDLQDRLGLVHGSIGTSLIAIKEFTIEIDQINIDISRKQIKKDEEKSKFELLQAQISALTVDDSEVRKAEKNFDDANLKKISAARNQGIYENEYKTKKYIADKLFGEVQRIVESNASDEFKNQINFIESCIDDLSKLIEEQEKSGRNFILNDMNASLKKHSKGNHMFGFEEKTYNPVILKNDGKTKVKLSMGGRKLKKNLFFVTSLIKHSKMRSKASGKIQIPGTIAPLVVDAPFSDLDQFNISIAARVLIESSDQLIVMISSSSFNGGFYDVLNEKPEYKKRLGKALILKRHYKGKKDTKSSLEVNAFGHNAPTAIYDSKNETSVIEEISFE